MAKQMLGCFVFIAYALAIQKNALDEKS